jgi:hypothetical protein
MSTLSEMHAKATALLKTIGDDLDSLVGDVEGHLRVVTAHLEHVVGAQPAPPAVVPIVNEPEPVVVPTAAVKRVSGKS